MDNTKKRILIVDDERFNITILVDTLKADYQIIIAKSGEEALERMMAPRLPDLILLDIMMPEMDGYEVCRRLKAEETTRKIPIVFITAMDDVQDEAKGLELGAIDYITKPISPPIVRARVKNHLALKHAREELEAQNLELMKAARLREDVERITRHDLKNPLNAIVGFPKIIKAYDNLNEKQADYLKKIENAGYKMLEMINLSLDLFKMERGIYQFAPTSVDLLQVIPKITEEFSTLTRQKRLSFDILFDDRSVEAGATFFVQGEELLCYSMLANLIKNALEASPRGGRVTLSLNGEGTAIIRVHNQGAVPEEIRGRFFEKYVTHGKKTDGTGLGTYSAKLIAETQNGSIDMTTSEQDGTCVTIRLPGVPAT